MNIVRDFLINSSFVLNDVCYKIAFSFPVVRRLRILEHDPLQTVWFTCGYLIVLAKGIFCTFCKVVQRYSGGGSSTVSAGINLRRLQYEALQELVSDAFMANNIAF